MGSGHVYPGFGSCLRADRQPKFCIFGSSMLSQWGNWYSIFCMPQLEFSGGEKAFFSLLDFAFNFCMKFNRGSQPLLYCWGHLHSMCSAQGWTCT